MSAKQGFASYFRWLCLVVGLGVVPLPCSSGADNVPSHPSKIAFEGNETFSADQLRNALLSEPDFLLAMHPYSAPSDLTALAKRLLVSGYRIRGFANIEIEARQTDHQLLCKIVEGPRYQRGQVIVNGAGKIDRAKLVQRLTTPYPKPDTFPTFIVVDGQPVTVWVDKDGKKSELNKPAWQSGKHVPFDNESGVQQVLAAAFGDLGYSNADAFVKFQNDPATTTTNLIVDIVREGDPDQARQIMIDGLEINSSEKLLAYLGLREGAAVDRRQTQQISRRLWESGRFAKHHVSFDAAKALLRIDVKEIPGLPAIDEALSADAASFQRAGVWLANSELQGNDVEMIFEHEGWRLRAVQSSQGMLLELTDLRDKTAPEKLSFLIDADSLLLNHTRCQTKFLVTPVLIDGKLRLTSKISAAANQDHVFQFGFTFNVNSDRAPGDPPVRHDWNITPADWLPFGYKTGFQKQIDGDILTATREHDLIKINRQTGAIVLLKSGDGSTRFQSGLFAAARTELLAATQSKPNAFQSDHPITTLVAYLVSDPIVADLLAIRRQYDGDASQVNPHLISAVQKLTDHGLLHGADELALKLNQTDDAESFYIPMGNPQHPSSQKIWIELFARQILQWAPQYFADDSWPMKVVREGCLVALDRSQHTSRVLGELLHDEQAGPLCHATIAYLVKFVNQGAARPFASKALQTLNAPSFRRDYEALTKATNSKIVIDALASIQSLSEDELDAVASMSSSVNFDSFLRMVQNHPMGKPESESLFWYRVANERLEQSLQSMLR